VHLRKKIAISCLILFLVAIGLISNCGFLSNPYARPNYDVQTAPPTADMKIIDEETVQVNKAFLHWIEDMKAEIKWLRWELENK